MKYLNDSNRFHLAIAVKSIEESKEFYCDLMGCVAGDYEEGRWQDINFWGNELTLHHGPDEVASKKDTMLIWELFQCLTLVHILKKMNFLL